MDGNLEEKTILNNVLSLVQQLLQLEDAEDKEVNDAMETGAGIEDKEKINLARMSDSEDEEDKDKAEKGEEEDDEGEEKNKKDEELLKKLAKAIMELPTDATEIANDPAESRASTGTEGTDENVKELARSIAKMITAKKTVKKSTSGKSSIEKSITTALNIMAKNQASLVKKQRDLETGLENVLKGLGVAEEIEKITKVSPVNSRVAKSVVSTSDANAFENYIKSLVSKSAVDKKEEENISDRDSIMKSLRKVATAFNGGNI